LTIDETCDLFAGPIHMSKARFHNRLHAGRQLAAALSAYAGNADALVLALPRGGVPVGFAVAKALRLALDVLLVRKLGLPAHPEFAMGAIATGGVRVLNQAAIKAFAVAPDELAAVCASEQAEITRRERRYRGARAPLVLQGRIAILVDDGLATGSTMRAGVAAARLLGARRVVVAIPVGAPDSCEALAAEVDELVCLSQPLNFRAVSTWYQNFDQTTDEEVQDLLSTAWRTQAQGAAGGSGAPPGQANGAAPGTPSPHHPQGEQHANRF
jgi:putative phosphoribosyl transferase